MEAVLHWLDTAGRVTLASIFVMTPGTIFWLTVLGIWLAFSQLQRSSHTTQ
jgi:hypothetical protein